MVSITKSNIRIKFDVSIPLPHKYQGGGVAIFRLGNKEPEVLLGLRVNRPGKGKWSFPGGGVEGKEKLSTAAFRELKEETGITLFKQCITRTGVFKIKKLFFGWNTFLIETTQKICISPKQNISSNGSKYFSLYGGEFLSLKWVPLSELKNYKLYYWVMDVVSLYRKGKMKEYKKKNSDELPRTSKPSTQTYSKSKKEVSMFDIAEMILFKTDSDGTKYFKPKYKIKEA